MPTSRAANIAAGSHSARKVAYQLLLSHDLKPHRRDLTDRVTEVKRTLASLIHTLRADR